MRKLIIAIALTIPMIVGANIDKKELHKKPIWKQNEKKIKRKVMRLNDDLIKLERMLDELEFRFEKDNEIISEIRDIISMEQYIRHRLMCGSEYTYPCASSG